MLYGIILKYFILFRNNYLFFVFFMNFISLGLLILSVHNLHVCILEFLTVYNQDWQIV